MKELGLSIALVLVLIGGLEDTAELAGFLATGLTQAEDLEDLLALDLDEGFELDFSTDLDSDTLNQPLGINDRDDE